MPWTAIVWGFILGAPLLLWLGGVIADRSA